MPKGPPPRLDLSSKKLEECKESDFPKEEKAKQLQTIILFNNKLTKVPPSFGTLFTNLRVLYFNNNELTTVPQEIFSLTNLTKLHLENNILESLPSSIGNLVQLKKLYLFNNQLEILPDEIGLLTNLELLSLHDNSLRVLNPHLAANTSLQKLAIHNNPIVSPPPFVYNKGIIPLMRYLSEIRESILFPVPQDEFIFTRKIGFFSDTQRSLKRIPSSKIFIKTSSSPTEKMDKSPQPKMIQAFEKSISRELSEGPVALDQNHLLYFLLDHSITEEQGRRDYMEDRTIAIPRLHQKRPATIEDEVINLFSKIGFFGVYDGHGGVRAADYLKAHLHERICNQDSFAKGDFETAIKAGFQKTDEEFLKLCKEKYYMDGTTSVVAMIIDNKLITAHAGDSRAVLCRDKKAIRLTDDHKPDRVDELTRIEELGGEVIFRGNCFRVSGDLAMSRSFGDLRLKEPLPLVISEPEIRIEELTPKDEFLILASDGLWDVISDQKAVDLVRKCATIEEASKKLVETALALGTMDNTSAIVVAFNWNLDFLTSEEIQGFVEMKSKKKGAKSQDVPKQKIETPKMEHKQWRDSTITEAMERTRSGTSSFRDTYVDTMALRNNHIRKSIYLPVTGEGIMLKIIIPSLSASKLMKFEKTALVKEIILMMIKKHRFVESVESYSLHLVEPEKESVRLDPKKQLQDYPEIKDKSTLELRLNTGAAPVVAKESPNEQFPEALIPAEYTKKVQEAQQSQQSIPIETQTSSNNNNSNVNINTDGNNNSSPNSPSLEKNSDSTPQESKEINLKKTASDTEEILGEFECSLFKLQDKEWKPQGSTDGKSKLCLVRTNGKIRIVGETSENQFIINCWMRKEYPFKLPEDTFVKFSSVVDGSQVHFGARFSSAQIAQQFGNLYQDSLKSLKE